MNRDLLICCFLGAVGLPAALAAEEPSLEVEEQFQSLDTTIVNSTQESQSTRARIERQSIVQQKIVPTVITKSPADEVELTPSYDTISGAELKQYQRYDLSDTLRQSAGITVVSTGQKGAQTSVFIRGFESNHAVYLLNGRRLPSGLGGLYQVEYLDTTFLESVQVVRGPASSLWGSDAISGAIDLRSTDARYVSEDTIETYVEGGSFETLRGGGKLTLRDGRLGLALESSYVDTANDRPSSDFENSNFRGNLAIDVADGVSVDVLGYIQHSELQVPGSSLSFFFPEPQFNENQSTLFSPRLTVERDDWSFSTFYSYTENKLEATRDVFFQDNRLEQAGHEAEAVLHLHPTDEATYTIGGGYYDYEFNRSPLENGLFVSPSDFRYSFASIFGQAEVNLPANFNLLASARHDGHDTFEDATTYTVRLSNDVEQTGTTFFAKTGTGYKVASGQDFVFLAPGFDPSTLEPEESESWEVGARQQLPGDIGSVSVTYFEADIENLIDVDPFTFIFPSQVDTETSGVEIEVNLHPCDCLDLYANYSHIDAVIVDGMYLGGFGGGPGDRLPRRPADTLSAGAILHGDRWKIGAEIQGAYSRFDSPGVFLNDYTLARIFGSYDVCERATIFGRIENLFDSDYETTRGYEGARLGAFGGIRMYFGD